MTTHELLPYAVALFTVTTVIGAALSIVRVVAQRKQRQRGHVAPFSHGGIRSDGYAFEYSVEEYSARGPKFARGKIVTVVLTGAAAAAAIASAIMALSH